MLIGNKTVDGKLISLLTNGSEKRILIKCDKCGKKNYTSWANYLRGQKLKNHNGKTFCRSCQSRNNIKIAHKKGPWNKGKYIPPEKRKGKSYITSDGYRAIFQYKYDRRYHSQWANYRKEHLVVMENHLGRQLKKEEIIHHIDGDKINNDISNLWLTSSENHRKAHNSLQNIGYYLFKSGIINFDKEKGEYFLVKK